MKSVLPELGVPSSEPGRIHSLESMPTLPGSGEAGVSFDLPAQADTLHSVNKVMKPPLLACLLFLKPEQFVCFFRVHQLHTIGWPRFLIWRRRLIFPWASPPSFHLPSSVSTLPLPAFVTFTFCSVASSLTPGCHLEAFWTLSRSCPYCLLPLLSPYCSKEDVQAPCFGIKAIYSLC